MSQVSRKKMVFFVPKEYNIPKEEDKLGRDEAATHERQAVEETLGDSEEGS